MDEREENRHRPHRDVPAVFLKREVEAHGQDAFADLHEKGGAPKEKEGADFLPIGSHKGETEPPNAALGEEEGDDPNAAHRLGNNGGPSRPFDPHVENENEQRIEGDVEHGADQDRKHRGGGLAHRRDETVEAERQLDEERPQGVDVHVTKGVVDRFLAPAESQKHRPVEQ